MSPIDRSYNEKRDFIRMKINSPVNISHAGKIYKGICKDLSGAGMLIETNQLFAVGDEVDISIEQKAENHLPFNAKAEVSRIDAGADDKHIVGLAITHIAD
jgi:hypothetical protein